MTIDHDSSERPGKGGKHVPPHERRRHWIVYPAVVIALAAGAAGGAAAMKMAGPTTEVAPMTPVSIATMPASSLVTIKGTVAEIYGNKFILQDDSGKTLVETGPAGASSDLIKPNEPITVQGRFDDGFVHASFLVGKDGKTQALRAPGPPPHGPFGDLIHRPGP